MPDSEGTLGNDAVARELIIQLLEDHPLPWHTGDGYPVVVVADDRYVIAKCLEMDTAKNLVELAKRTFVELQEGPFEMLCL